MPKGAIHINEAPRNYRFRAKAISDYTPVAGADYSATGYLEIYWGTSDKIRVRIENWFDGTTEYHLITLSNTMGWAADTVISGTGWISPVECIIEIDNLELAVAEDCTWALEFSELRFYVDGSLEETIGAQAETGSGFDLRKDAVWLGAVPMERHTFPVCDTSGTATSGSCGISFDDFDETSEAASMSVTGGWQWWDGMAWNSDITKIKTSPASIPTTTCECVPSASFATWEYLHDEDSWYIVVAGDYLAEQTKTLGEEKTCTCTGGYEIRQYWDYQIAFDLQTLWAHCLPSASRIYDHRYHRSVDCGLDSESIDTDLTESETYLEQSLYGDRRTSHVHCWDLVDSQACLEGEDPNPCLPAFPTLTDIFCCTKLQIEISWLTLPPCDHTIARCVCADYHRDGRRFRAYLNDGGNVEIERATRMGSWSGADTGIAASWCSIQIEKAKPAPRLFLVIVDSSDDIVEYVSTDGGLNFTLSSTLATGTLKYPASKIELDNRRFVYWYDGGAIKGLIRDSAGNTLASAFTAVASVDDSSFAVEIRNTSGSELGQVRIDIQCVVSGAVVEYSSTDGKTFV